MSETESETNTGEPPARRTACGTSAATPSVRIGKVLDQSLCIGCHACTTACKSENQVPLSVTRTYVKSVDVGMFPAARREFQVTRCNQCEDAPCVSACPTSAMFQRPDGIVDFDKGSCIGCKACIAACPYDAIFINPEDHSAEKCNFCAHRLDSGLEPACVVVCPVGAIYVGDINDRTSKLSEVISRNPVEVRRPDKGTRPKVFYRGASQRTLDPLAAVQPPGGIFAWAQQAPDGHHQINSGVPAALANTSQAAAILSYDIGHSIPWDWRVGLYTWTKSIAAGLYLVTAALLLADVIAADDTLWTIVTPLLGLAFLGFTGLVLIWDLEHPSRFYFIFTRPQWRSWLVRGGVLIGGYGLVLCAQLLAGFAGLHGWTTALTVAGIPLALMTAVYTAFLFAQAKARDLWQNSLLPPHLAVQSLLAGAATLQLVTAALGWHAPRQLAWTIAGSAVIHLLMVMGELRMPHSTAHTHLAIYNLTHGPLGRFFWLGAAMVGIAVGAPIAATLAAPLALLGLLAHEHAYVQAAQSVPLA